MSFDNDLRQLLKDKAADAGPPSPAPTSLLRRGRRRQVLTVFTSSLVVAALLVGSLAGFATLRGEGVVTPGADLGIARTSIVEDIEVTYPSAWSLAELNDEVVVGTGRAGPTGSIEGHAIFQLSNLAPAAGSSITYPAECSGSGPPDGSVVLYVQTLRYPRVPGSQSPPWPVSIDGQVKNFTTCEPSIPPRYATWTASGRIFEAIIYGSPGPDLDRMLHVFAGLRFGTGPTGPRSLPGVGPVWVLDSGIAGAQRWNLLAYASKYPLAPTRACVGFEVNGWFLKGECNLNMSLDPPGSSSIGIEASAIRVRVGTQVVSYVYGGSTPPDATVTTELTRGTAGAPRLSQMPDSLEARFEAVVVVGSAHVGGLIRSTANRPGMGAFPYFSMPRAPVEVKRLPALGGAS